MSDTPAADGETLRPLRIAGGFVGAMRAALGGWWREIFVLTLLNLLWAIAALSVIGLPPATAAMFYVARQVLSGDPFVDARTFGLPFRRYGLAAWRWALVFVGLAAVAGSNLWVYQDAPGTLWTVLRWVWATLLFGWLALNLFFWPLWFAQDEAYRTLRATWRNGFAFVAANPLAALLVTLATLGLGTASFFFGLPLGLIFMVWTALLATATLAAYLPTAEEQRIGGMDG